MLIEKAGCGDVCLSSQAMWEAEIGRITISGQPRKKSETLSPAKKGWRQGSSVR
jgi:hypothetical protein